jgi:hypothetical protein
MVDVQVRQQYQIQVGHRGAALTEPQGRATASIDEDARHSVVPDEVAGRRALVLEFRATRPQHLQRHTCSAAAGSIVFA